MRVLSTGPDFVGCRAMSEPDSLADDAALTYLVEADPALLVELEIGDIRQAA